MLQRFFSFFYFSINVGSLTAMAIVPWLRVWCGYAVAFMVPAILMLLSLVAIWHGDRFIPGGYRHVPPEVSQSVGRSVGLRDI